MDETFSLSVNDIRKSYGDTEAVRGISFIINKGEVFGLLGPNGAGKSTTIAMVSTLISPTSGSVFVFGIDTAKNSTTAKRMIGVIPQEISLFDELTARENLAFFGGLYGLQGKNLSIRISEILELVGLSKDADRRIGVYSGGMKRRINIGASIMHNPPLVLLDEPTAGVDPQSRLAIFELVERLRQSGTSFLYTTHYMEEAERLCDRIGIIDEGKIIASGTLPELLKLIPDLDRIEIQSKGLADRSVELLKVKLAEFEPDVDISLIRLKVKSASTKLSAILEMFTDYDLSVESIRVIEPNLESVFIQLTGKALRDGDK